MKHGHLPLWLNDSLDKLLPVIDVFEQPSKYVKVIRQMIDIYNLQHKTTKSSTNQEKMLTLNYNRKSKNNNSNITQRDWPDLNYLEVVLIIHLRYILRWTICH